jgi:hypothetical protein
MPKKPTKKDCAGCYNDFYNYNNPGGSAEPFECWSLKSAEFIKARIVHIDDVPPHKGPIVKIPSCWRGQRRLALKIESK